MRISELVRWQLYIEMSNTSGTISNPYESIEILCIQIGQEYHVENIFYSTGNCLNTFLFYTRWTIAKHINHEVNACLYHLFPVSECTEHFLSVSTRIRWKLFLRHLIICSFHWISFCGFTAFIEPSKHQRENIMMPTFGVLAFKIWALVAIVAISNMI